MIKVQDLMLYTFILLTCNYGISSDSKEKSKEPKLNFCKILYNVPCALPALVYVTVNNGNSISAYEYIRNKKE